MEKKGKALYQFSLMAFKAITATDLLYKNAVVYLDRKYQKHLEFMETF